VVSDLGLTVEQEKALGEELDYLKERLAANRAVRDFPSIQRRQRELSRLSKHVKAVRLFARELSSNTPSKYALQDMVLGLGILTESFRDQHTEYDDATFVARWLSQSEVVEKIIEATLKHAVDPTRGMKIPPHRKTLIAKILPTLFEKITGDKLARTRGGLGFRFIRCCLDTLGESGVEDETIMTLMRPPSGTRPEK
jgi:hypothetical protein